MGFYLNSRKPYILFQDDRFSTYFIDKSKILKDLIPIVEHSNVNWGNIFVLQDPGVLAKLL